MGYFSDEGNTCVHDSASRSEVVKRDQRVHLEFRRAQQALNHGETDGFEGDTTNLVDESDQDEFDLPKRSNDDTDYNERDIAQGLEVGRSNAQSPSREKHGDGSSCLEFRQPGRCHEGIVQFGVPTFSIWIKETLK